MIDVLKFFGAPGSIPFLVLAVGAGLALTRTRRWRRAGFSWLAVVTAGYVILALPPVARALVRTLPPVAMARAHCDVLVVLDGDNRRGRAREVARLVHVVHPPEVWVLGDRWILDALTEAGLPTARFHHDASARTTREQIDQVAEIAARTNGCVAVVSSRLQAPRVAALVRTRRLDVAVRSAPIDAAPAAAGLARFLPSYTALRTSRDTLYEIVALVYYQWHGWIR